MFLNDFVSKVTAKSRTTKEQSRATVKAFCDTLTEILGNGDSITLHEFGTFKVVERAARECRNLRTGEKLTIYARKSVKFTPAKKLSERGAVSVRQGKSEMVKRVVPNAAYMIEAAKRFEADSKLKIRFVCHNKGKKVREYRTAWLKACRLAGVNMRFYDIRHIAATSMLAAGADLAATSAQLGHSSVATTGNIYAHSTISGQSHAASVMPMIE